MNWRRVWQAIRAITFEFSLDLGILRVYTALWREPWERDSRDYVCVFVWVLGREVFKFNLYETGMSLMQRTKC